ncbi:hypothetical protein N7481_003460 [Penicillium waksmanii]|uniref:uncharacterized protein n=1 Tax=Penicillium waksmanii TaxID=69791 RepID=UPI00254662F5|nr:uncharacterized protein N7481_003460 [Penicillium waksmanii]KAJ5988250.1 hypothetical protein N7481_003460 [Penicillium waksmanii]
MIQLASRIFTFASNQLILRTLSPIVLGISAQLELFQVTILYFSRESIRMAIQRQPLASNPSSSTNDNDKDNRDTDSDKQSLASQSVVNVSYLSLFLGVIFTAGLTWFYKHFAPEQAHNTPFFNQSVTVTGLASLLELTIEPFFAVIQQRMWYEKRAAVELPAAFLKSLVTCSTFFYASRQGHDVGPLPFALGYLAYSTALIFGNNSEYISGLFSRRLTFLAATLFFQSLVKHLLTQGDSMMLAAMSSLEDQGIYSLASNYGGLIARIIFQPLEESSRNLFSALLSQDGPNSKRTDVQLRTAKGQLVTILRAYQLLSALVLPIGPIMVPTVLNILGGRQWASPKVADLLSLYCYYIPFLAFNGITEAFVSSAANPSEIRTQTGWMGAFSACYALAAYLFLEVGSLGAYGLVLANIVNMAVRTLWSYCFIRSFFRKNGSSLGMSEISMKPAAYILSALATVASQMVPSLHTKIIPAIAFSGVYALLMLYVERKYIMQQLAEIRQIASSRAKGPKKLE